jgi:NIMA (never in mitosis gene a)-related kinase 1/4/5
MDNYKRIKLLGKGGFGSAILVEKRDGGRQQLVLKEVLLQPGAGHAKAVEDAKREASFLKSLHHPNIVSFIDTFAENGNLYIVMEYADGGDLHQRISQLKSQQKSGGMPEEEALNYFVQICLAIKHIHDRKILHRDLKSQNVFLTKKGIVKVGDFGIAKSLSSSMDMAKTQIGTPYYLSPEICCDKPYNKKSDMWALGVVLYEMLALSLPFLANDLPRLVTKILAGKYAPLPPQYSRATRSLVESLLQKDPKQRPSINAVLRTEVIRSRMQGFLTQTLAVREFGEALKLAAPIPPSRNANKPTVVAIANSGGGSGGGGGIVNVVSRQPLVVKIQPSASSSSDVDAPITLQAGPGNVVQSAAAAAAAATAIEREKFLKVEREKMEREKAAAADRVKAMLLEKERAAKAASDAQQQQQQQQRANLAIVAAHAAAEEQHRRKLKEAVERERALQRDRERKEAQAIAAARMQAEAKRAKVIEHAAHAEQSEAFAALEKAKRREHAKIAREKWVEARKKEWENNASSSSSAGVARNDDELSILGDFVVMISPDPHEGKHVRSLSAINEAEQAKHDAYLARLEEARKTAFADRQAAAERARMDRLISGGGGGGGGGESSENAGRNSSHSSPPQSHRDRARSRSESSDNTEDSGAASFVKAAAKERRAAELRAHDEALRNAARQSFEEKRLLQEAKIERERAEREQQEREKVTIMSSIPATIVSTNVEGSLHSKNRASSSLLSDKQSQVEYDHEAALASARIAAFQERKLLEQRRAEAVSTVQATGLKDEEIDTRPQERVEAVSIRAAPVALMVYLDADGKEGDQPPSLRPKPVLRLGKDRQKDISQPQKDISQPQKDISQAVPQILPQDAVISAAKPPKAAVKLDASHSVMKKVSSASVTESTSVKEGPVNTQSGASSARAVEVLRAIDRARIAADAVRGSYPPFLAPKSGAVRSALSTPASSSLPVPSSSSLGNANIIVEKVVVIATDSVSSPPKPLTNLYREMNQEKRLQVAVQKRLGLKPASSSKQFVSALQNQHKRGIPSDKSILLALHYESEEREDKEYVEKVERQDGVNIQQDQLKSNKFEIYDDIQGAVRQLENFESMEGRTIGVTVEETFFSALMNAPSAEESSSDGRLDEDQTLINALLGGIAPPSLSARDTLEVSLEEDEWSAADKDAVNHEVAVAGLQDDILLALAIGESTIEEEEEEEEEEER